MNVEMALRNTVALLQQHPGDYRKFGPYWWLVKAALIKAGYTRDNLSILGGYMPDDAASMINISSLQDGLSAAFSEYGRAHFAGSLATTTADGDFYVASDPDADGL